MVCYHQLYRSHLSSSQLVSEKRELVDAFSLKEKKTFAKGFEIVIYMDGRTNCPHKKVIFP